MQTKPSGLEYRLLTTSKEREASAQHLPKSCDVDIANKTNTQCSCIVRRCVSTFLFCVDVPLLQVNLPAPLLRQSLPRLPTNLGNKNIEPSKRRLVCFVARVKTYSVIQSAGTTPPSGIRLVLSMAPFACLSRTKLAYPLLPPKAGDRVYQVTYFSS